MQGSNKPERVYDSAISFVYTSYNITGNRNDLRFDSSGEIDRLLRIYPNVESVHSYDAPIVREYSKREHGILRNTVLQCISIQL